MRLLGISPSPVPGNVGIDMHVASTLNLRFHLRLEKSCSTP